MFSVPAGVVAATTLLFCIPNDFPYHGRHDQKKRVGLRSIDTIGATLMLATITLLITGFEEASNFEPWRSAQVLAPILISGPFLVAFLFYERFLTLKRNSTLEPVFPWRFCTSKVIMGILT